MTRIRIGLLSCATFLGVLSAFCITGCSHPAEEPTGTGEPINESGQRLIKGASATPPATDSASGGSAPAKAAAPRGNTGD